MGFGNRTLSGWRRAFREGVDTLGSRGELLVLTEMWVGSAQRCRLAIRRAGPSTLPHEARQRTERTARIPILKLGRVHQVSDHG